MGCGQGEHVISGTDKDQTSLPAIIASVGCVHEEPIINGHLAGSDYASEEGNGVLPPSIASGMLHT